MKYIGTYSNDADIATKAKVDAKQDKVLANGILQGDGAGTISAAETQEVELVTLTKADVGLGNVDNTSDANKPISTATQTALNGKQATITGGASTITSSNLTANRALVSDASGKVAVSAVTSTELGYLDGVTSNIQTQLNGKLSSAPVTSVNGATGATKSTFHITAIKDGDNLAVDKTLEEVYEAYTAGYAVYANYSDSAGPYVGTLPIQTASPDMVEFKALIYVSDTDAVVAELVCSGSEWISNVYAVPTQTYVDDSKQSIIIDNGFLYGNGAGRVTAKKPVYVVTLISINGSDLRSNKTAKEIFDAYSAGCQVVALFSDVITPMTVCLRDGEGTTDSPYSYTIMFDGPSSQQNVNQSSQGYFNNVIYAYGLTGSGDSFNAVTATSVPTTRIINNKALSSDVFLTAADINAVGLTGDQTIAGSKIFTEKATFDLGFTAGGSTFTGGCIFTGQQSFNNGIVVGGKTYYKENSYISGKIHYDEDSTVDFTNATVTGISGILPTVTTSNNGQFLRVVNGAWAAATVENANGVSF